MFNNNTQIRHRTYGNLHLLFLTTYIKKTSKPMLMSFPCIKYQHITTKGTKRHDHDEYLYQWWTNPTVCTTTTTEKSCIIPTTITHIFISNKDDPSVTPRYTTQDYVPSTHDSFTTLMALPLPSNTILSISILKLTNSTVLNAQPSQSLPSIPIA